MRNSQKCCAIVLFCFLLLIRLSLCFRCDKAYTSIRMDRNFSDSAARRLTWRVACEAVIRQPSSAALAPAAAAAPLRPRSYKVKVACVWSTIAAARRTTTAAAAECKRSRNVLLTLGGRYGSPWHDIACRCFAEMNDCSSRRRVDWLHLELNHLHNCCICTHAHLSFAASSYSRLLKMIYQRNEQVIIPKK